MNPEGTKCWNTGYTTSTRVEDDFKGVDLPPMQGGIILDAGCSIGISTENLSKLYPDCNILGIDKDRSRISDAYRRLRDIREGNSGLPDRVKFRQGDLYKLAETFAPDIFQGIFAMNNLSYVAKRLTLDQHISIAKGFHETLTEGGLLFISGSGEWEPRQDSDDVFVKAILRKSGRRFEEILVNSDFRNQDYFGNMAWAYLAA